MKNKIKDLVCLGVIFLGAILFDRTSYKLTGVLLIIFGFVMDMFDVEE